MSSTFIECKGTKFPSNNSKVIHKKVHSDNLFSTIRYSCAILFGIIKSELLYAENFESSEAFMKALDEYIDYYNNKRIKSRLKGKNPVQYRTLSQIG